MGILLFSTNVSVEAAIEGRMIGEARKRESRESGADGNWGSVKWGKMAKDGEEVGWDGC